MNTEFRPSRVLTGLAGLVLAVTTATAQTPVQVQLNLRPVSNDDISAYKLPSTTQKSGGLTTIGIGQPAYLEARVNIGVAASDLGGVTWKLTSKPADSKADLEQSPLGMNVPLYEPSDRLLYRLAGRQMLRPDVVGRYTVTASVSIGTVGTKDASVTITAGTYLGANACNECHSGGRPGTKWAVADTWAKTGHAMHFTRGINGELEGGSYGSGCISCHTVGYDTNPQAVNNGFDDVMAKLGWQMPAVFKAGNWDAVPDALKNLANIQCENCHGPGSEHVANGGDYRLISVSLNSGTCGQCHGALTHHIKPGEWSNSVHAVATSYPSGAGHEECVGCHTGQGFISRMKGKPITSTNYLSINCQTCHDPHGRTNPEDAPHLIRSEQPVQLADGTKVTDAGAGLLCMNCHQSRQNAAEYAATAAPSAHFGPHHGPQADMLAGANGFTYGLAIPTSAHGAVVEDTCVGCHMQTVAPTDPTFLKAGGHTFRPSTTDGVELVAKCRTCHGSRLKTFNFQLLDYNDDGKIDGVQTEVQHLLDQLSSMLPPYGNAKKALTINSSWTRAELEAGYNWQFVKEDGSFGIHNTAYAVGLLKASIADLEANRK